MRLSVGLKIVRLFFVIFFVVVGIMVFQPNWFISLLAKRSPKVIYYVATQEPVVALTIDDGPDPVSTPKILDLLRQYNGKATFFVISNHLPGNEKLIRRLVAEGHELANHLTSDKPSILLNGGEFEKQLLEAHRMLSGYSKIRWFRPGSGWYNEKMLEVIHRHGYRCALGSVHPFDPQIPSSWFTTHYVLRRVRPGAIIVLHDFRGRGRRTIKALETILPELKRRGFRLVTLSELVDHYGPEK